MQNYSDEPIGFTEHIDFDYFETVPHVSSWKSRGVIWANESDKQEWHTLDELNEFVRMHDIIELHGVNWTTARLNLVNQATMSAGTPKLLFVKIDFGIPWANNVKTIELNSVPYQFSKLLNNSKIKPTYKKDVSTLSKIFMTMAMGKDPGRRELLMFLQSLGLLDDSIYSSRSIESKDYSHLLKHLGAVKQFKVESQVIGGKYERFDLQKNITTLIPIIETCHFYVAGSNNILNRDQKHDINEKAMWAVSSGTPSMLIATPREQARMQSWGFDLEYLPSRLPHEAEWQALQRWTAMISLWHSIATDADKAQHWYEQKAESIAKNNHLVRILHTTIAQHIQKQIDELPREWITLK